MKERFTTIDLFAVLQELRQRLLGMRVANVYDIDQKTYYIKLARPDEKVMLLFESGCRLHTTEFEWPKNMMPSGFSMKLRKHLRTRRLVSISQLGVDRVIDLQFGSNEAAYHLIIELYDRGNVILTDHAYTILSLLRTRTDTDTETRFAVREAFSLETIKHEQPPPSEELIRSVLSAAKPGDQLKHVLNPHFVYGSALLSHCLIGTGFRENTKLGSGFDLDSESDLARLMGALGEADVLFRRLRDEPSKGYIIQKREVQPQVDPAAQNGEGGEVFTNVEFHPMLFRQHEKAPFREFDTFDKAVDEFFSSRSGQKQDLKALHLQKGAVKKLDNIRKDHQRRIDALQKTQEEDIYRAQLVELNADLVERASLVIRSAIANAMDWGDIELLVRDAQARGDPIAMAIHGLKLNTNEITLLLRNPMEEEGEEGETERRKKPKTGTKVDIDLALSAFANARRYYSHKKHAARKEQKTLDASGKALKSAEKKTKQTLKEVSTVAKIKKARKVHWFEKFYWLISSENYLVIGGRDQQQNEIVVKKYLDEGDLYVHADLHGATSIIIKNPSGGPVPPKTLNEAGTMAVCYSSAWDARIVTSAWWVYHHQVSKTAPTGEYLTTGSFMIRGKKNFLPPCQLVMGFGFLFRVEDSCIPNHLHERRVRDDQASLLSEAVSDLALPEEEEESLGGSDSEQEEKLEGGSEEEESLELTFPDTSIQLQHIAGEKYELQRGVSVASSSSQLDEADQQGESPTGAIDQEDGELQAQDKGEDKRHQHLSVKQRRELRKQARQKPAGSVDQPDSEEHEAPLRQPNKKKKEQPPQPVLQPQQHKRGQKSKLKKVQDKYGDQDEEERQLRMEILASAGAAKEQKVKKSGKKGKKDPTQPSNPKYKYHQKGKSKGQPALVETTHKQKAPLFVSVSEDLTAERQTETLEEDGRNAEMETRAFDGGDLVVEDVEDGRSAEIASLERRPFDGGDLVVEDVEDGDIEDAVEKGETTGSEHVRTGSAQLQETGAVDLEDNAKTQGQSSFQETDTPTMAEARTLTEGSAGEEVTVQADSLHESDSTGISSAASAIGISLAETDSSEINTQLTEPTLHEASGGQEVDSDDEEKRALLAEENIQQLEETTKEQLSVLDSFTGCPLPEDILLYAIPACAPYTALLNYKYKVKLVPGTNRRGKAAKAALHRFIQSREASQREKDLLKSVKDTDLSRYIPGKVKMTLPQAYKQQRSQ